jgi:branched-chain amino acid transport system permease protein
LLLALFWIKAEMELAVSLIIHGILIGLVFALASLGLSLIYGVMNIINFAHGDFLMVGMFITFLLSLYLPIDPLIAVPLAGVGGFLLGITSYRFLIDRILRGPRIAQLFGTFGLMMFIRHLFMLIFGPEIQSVEEGILVGERLSIGWFSADMSRVVGGGVCLLLFGLVYWMINRTRLGRALRAVSIDGEAAHYMGIDVKKMNTLVWGIGGAATGVAGGLLAHFYPIDPTVGMIFVLVCIATVALGGFGSVSGAFFAGLVIGIIQTVGAFFVPELRFTFVYLTYFLIVVIRPRGLFGQLVE